MTSMLTVEPETSGLSRVPVLQSNGGNWTIFETRFRHFAKSKALWEHFTGTSSRPAAIAAQADIDAWQKREDEAHNYLAQRLEDTTLLLADEFNTVAEMWEWITNEFTALSSHVLASMQAEFDALTCGENGNVRAHLEQLQLKYKALVAVGVKLSDSQYATRIINSLPRYFQRYLATITSSAKAALMASNLARTAAAQAQAAGSVSTAPTSLTITSGNTAANHAVTLSPGYLMHLESPREDLGVALSAQGSQTSLPQHSGNGNGGGNSWRGNGQRPNGVCWNCGGRGHFKSQCPSPKEGSSSASETANAAVSFDDIDGAWSVVPVDSVPDTVDRTLGSGWLRVAPETVFDMEEASGEASPAPVLMSICEPDSVSVANRREYLPDVPPALRG